MKYVISLDWLSFWGECFVPEIWANFKAQKRKFGTSNFAEVVDLLIDNEIVFTIAYKPRSAIFSPNTAQIKVNNRRLYTGQWLFDMEKLKTECNIEKMKISRLDICADFSQFWNNLQPKGLINKFLTMQFVKTGRGKFYVVGTQRKYIDCQYLRFGKGDSDVSAYLYNKTKELEEVKDKPYIREIWANNLDTNKGNIWRLEFSLKSQALKIVNNYTGELIAIDTERITNRKFLGDLYLSMVSKYFSFQLAENQKNKSRWQRVKLFPEVVQVYDIVKIPEYSDTSRKHKIFLKNLVLLDKEMRTLKQAQAVEVEMIAEQFAREHNLIELLERAKYQNSHYE